MMPYPVNTFSNFTALFNYINTYIVTNGAEEIDAIDANDVMNGLLTFITQSPLNYQKAQIISTGGAVVTSRPISVITTTLPTSLAWIDNIYNQQIIINTTNSNIPLLNGFVYYDSSLTVKNSIPAYTTIAISKVSNGSWIQTNQAGGTIAPKLPISGVVGASGLPQADATSYTDNRIAGLGLSNGGNISFTLAGAIYVNYGTNESFTYNSTTGTIVLLYGTFPAGVDFSISLNQ